MNFRAFRNHKSCDGRQRLRALINGKKQSMGYFLMIALLGFIHIDSALAHHQGGSQPSWQTQAPAAEHKIGKGTGLIQQIDREKGTVTIKHGPLQGINMPAMTMSYLVKDKAMLSNLWSPQMVDFELTYDGKQYLITHIK